MTEVGLEEKEYLDLLTLQRLLKSGVEELFPTKLWVKAEIASVSRKQNGHCYLDLCQNDESGTVARVKAAIWRSRFLQLNNFFAQATGTVLQAGMSVLVRVQVSYNELYGLTLSIDDIDPAFTIGEKEQEKKRTIARLEQEGLMDKQKQLSFPVLPYSLAVISASSAAGFGDFCRHLAGNSYGFVFQVELFEAVMQGVTAPDSIIDALSRVESAQTSYDAVLLLRGGGAELDLACFDDYRLCAAIASCPLPVITAIGHERDYHVADMVAYSYEKTPTALADVFIDCYMAEDERICSFETRLKLAFVNKIAAMMARVDLLENRIQAADPRKLLSRGYTLVADSGGRLIKEAKGIAPGDILRIMFADGTLSCEVKDRK